LLDRFDQPGADLSNFAAVKPTVSGLRTALREGQTIQVGTGTEPAAVAFENDHAEFAMVVDPANGLSKIREHRVVDRVQTSRSIQHEVAGATVYLRIQSRKLAPAVFDFRVQGGSPDGRALYSM